MEHFAKCSLKKDKRFKGTITNIVSAVINGENESLAVVAWNDRYQAVPLPARCEVNPTVAGYMFSELKLTNPDVYLVAKAIIDVYDGLLKVPKELEDSPEPARALAYYFGFEAWDVDGCEWWHEVMDIVADGELPIVYATAKKATKAEARALRIGDIIEALYTDDYKPVIEVVVQACDADGDYMQVRTLSKAQWESGVRGTYARGLNTDKFKRVGRLEFKADWNA